jgi:hypothetical protein
MAREDGQVAPEFADAEEGDIRFLCYEVSFSFDMFIGTVKFPFEVYVNV